MKLDVSYIKDRLDPSYIENYLDILNSCTHNFLLVLNALSINMDLRLVQAGSFTSGHPMHFHIMSFKNSKITFNNLKLKDFLCDTLIITTNSTINAKTLACEGVQSSYYNNSASEPIPTKGLAIYDSQINIENVYLKGFGEGAHIRKGQITINNWFVTNIERNAIEVQAEANISLNKLNISNCVGGLVLYSMNSTVPYTGHITIDDCNFNKCNVAIKAQILHSLLITSCKIQKGILFAEACFNINIKNLVISEGHADFVQCHNVLLTKCKVTPPPSTDPKDRSTSISARGSTNMIIDGGDYRNANNQSTEYNIYVGGSYGSREYQNPSTIRLINNPLGGSIAHHGGKIIKG